MNKQHRGSLQPAHSLPGGIDVIHNNAKLWRLSQKPRASELCLTESFCSFAAFSMPTTSLGCYYQQDFGPPA